MEQTESVWDVIVVGGGLSGLAAAHQLQKRGAKVIVLEARDRVGGRTCTETFNGHAVDVGGAYVGGTQDYVLRLAKEFDIKTYKIYTEGKSILRFGDKQSEYYGAIPSLPILTLLDSNSILIKLHTDSLQISIDAPWESPSAKDLDSLTVKEYVSRHTWCKDAALLVHSLCKGLLCAEPEEVSALYFLWFIRQAGGVNRLIEVENGAQEGKFHGGAQTISNKLMEALGGEEGVLLSHPVAEITQETESTVVVRTRNGSKFQCCYVILAVPPALYTKIAFSPTLPGLKQQLSQKMPMGSIIKTVMYYSKPFWREAGYSATLLSDEGPVVYTFDDTQPDGSHPGIMGFVLAKHCREWVHKTKDERMKAIAAQYAKVFNTDEALTPAAYIEKDWTQEEFSGGCYLGYMAPLTLTSYGKELRKSFGRIYFAGTETATKWAGYMDGAIQAGERAAYKVVVKLAEDEKNGGRKEATNKITPPGPWSDWEPEPSEEFAVNYSGPKEYEKYLPSPPTVVVVLLGILALGVFGIIKYKATKN